MMKSPSKTPWKRDDLRLTINGIADIAEEWAAIMGEPAKGSEQWEFQEVLNEINSRLSRLSFSLHRRGMEAAEPGDLIQP